MSIKRTLLNEYRHVPRIVRTGLFERDVVLVLQQRYHDKGEISTLPDVTGFGRDNVVNNYGWTDCKSIPCTWGNALDIEWADGE